MNEAIDGGGAFPLAGAGSCASDDLDSVPPAPEDRQLETQHGHVPGVLLEVLSTTPAVQEEGTKFIEYFAVCGLGCDAPQLKTSGWLYQMETDRFAGTDLKPLAPALVDRFPADDHPNFPMPEVLPSMVLPQGVRVHPGCRGASSREGSTRTSYTVVLTTSGGGKVYVTALVFQDRVDPYLVKKHKLPRNCRADKCLCIISRLPFLAQFTQMLEALHRLCFRKGGCPRPFWDMVEDMFRIPVPQDPHTALLVKFQREILSLTPLAFDKPRPPHVSFSPLVNSLDVSSIVRLFTAALLGSRILLLSSNTGILTPAAEAIAALLHPFQWTGAFVPVLPADALDLLDVRFPYLYGAPTAGTDVRWEYLEGVVVANLDCSSVTTCAERIDSSRPLEAWSSEVDELPRLPEVLEKKVAAALDHLLQLQRQAGQWEQTLEAEMFSNLYADVAGRGWGSRHDEHFQLAFIRCLASLFGGYRNYFSRGVGSEGGRTEIFDVLSFIEAKCDSLGADAAPLLRCVTRSQTWANFLAAQPAFSEASPSFFDEAIMTADTPMELLLAFPQQENAASSAFFDASQELRPKSECEQATDEGEAAGEKQGKRHEDGIVYKHIPESPASTIMHARAQATAKGFQWTMSKVSVQKQAELQRRRQDLMARVSYHLKMLELDPNDIENRKELSEILHFSQCVSVGAREFIHAIERQFCKEELNKITGTKIVALQEVLELLLQHRKDQSCRTCESVACVMDVASRLYSVDEEGRETFLSEGLRHLDVWHFSEFWAHVFKLKAKRWSAQDRQDNSGAVVVMGVVRLMVSVGVKSCDIGKLLDSISEQLPSDCQVILWDQLGRLQDLMDAPHEGSIRPSHSWKGGEDLDAGPVSRKALSCKVLGQSASFLFQVHSKK